MSDNWIVQLLEYALRVWNEKLVEIWDLATKSPKEFRGGAIWGQIVKVNGTLQAIGLALLVLFFFMEVIRTCMSFKEMRRPEYSLKLFVKFVLAKYVITNGLDLMIWIFEVVQGIANSIINAFGFSSSKDMTLPPDIVSAIEKCDFLSSIPLWIVSLLGVLVVTVLAFVLILSVYGRFFKLFMYTAIAPIPISTFAGKLTSDVGKTFMKSYISVCLESVVIVLACGIFSLFAKSSPDINVNESVVVQVWKYLQETAFSMLILVGTVKGASRIVKEMFGQ